jgi:hypothetical protein
VDHPQGIGASDDFANSLFGMIWLAASRKREPMVITDEMIHRLRSMPDTRTRRLPVYF